MLALGDGGVNAEMLRALRTWMSLDDLDDAIELRLHQKSWEDAARTNAKTK
jgi:hypothetical protein